MTYSSCQNKGPVILRVYIRVPLNFLMFKDALIKKNSTVLKN